MIRENQFERDLLTRPIQSDFIDAISFDGKICVTFVSIKQNANGYNSITRKIQSVEINAKLLFIAYFIVDMLISSSLLMRTAIEINVQL